MTDDRRKLDDLMLSTFN